MDRDFARPWRRAARYRRRARISPVFVMAPLAVFTAVFLWDSGPPGFAFGFATPRAGPDVESARFGKCAGRAGYSCVIDGDSLRYRGEQIRIADINAPEMGHPRCPREAELARAAEDRLRALLNAGPFTLERIDRDADRYGRSLRVITRDGQSIGEQLVREGLAERWKGYRGAWC